MPDFLQDKLKEIANEVDENIVSANPSGARAYCSV